MVIKAIIKYIPESARIQLEQSRVVQESRQTMASYSGIFTTTFSVLEDVVMANENNTNLVCLI